MAKSNNSGKPQSGNSGDTASKIAAWQAILIALITTIGGIVTGYLAKKDPIQQEKEQVPVNVTPKQNNNVVDKLPVENNADLYELRKDISIFDLRQWKPTPDSLKNTRFSPANYTNYLHIKKTKPLDEIVIHYATTGYAIDMRCITNAFDFYEKKKATNHDGTLNKEYALVINISDIPLNQEFLIVVEATYWNGSRNLKEEDFSTYTDNEIHGLDELGLIVFFPEGKPFKSLERLDRDNGKGKEKQYRGTDNYYEDINKKFVYWSIKNKLANHHYRLKWTW